MKIWIQASREYLYRWTGRAYTDYGRTDLAKYIKQAQESGNASALKLGLKAGVITAETKATTRGRARSNIQYQIADAVGIDVGKVTLRETSLQVFLSEDTLSLKSRPTCPECGRLLNPLGQCPVHDPDYGIESNTLITL